MLIEDEIDLKNLPKTLLSSMLKEVPVMILSVSTASRAASRAA